MEKLKWCMGRKKGLKVTDENANLSREYIENAEESLRVLLSIRGTKSNMWLATTKYYIEYFAVYAFLMRIGVKCEIHECTIELSRLFEKKGYFRKGTALLLEKDKKLRIDNQYYLKDKPVVIDTDMLRDFILDMKNRIDGLSENDVQRIRSMLRRYQ